MSISEIEDGTYEYMADVPRWAIDYFGRKKLYEYSCKVTPNSNYSYDCAFFDPKKET